MMRFFIVQGLGLGTLLLFVISLQQRKKENLLLFQVAGTTLFIVQYILTGKYTGAVLFAVVLIRGLVFWWYKSKNLQPSRIVLLIFLAVLSVSAWFSWQNWLSVIPLIATTVKTWGTWQDDMKNVRKTSLLSQSSMIAYNLSAGMFTGALTELCNLVSTMIAIKRFDCKNNR